MKQPPFPEIEMFPPFEGFPKEGILFLKKLKSNNNREWFAKHKQQYEEHVKFPMQSFISAISQPLRTIAPEFHADPKKSLFRIYRDTRFSKNKLPYKTHVAAIFHPRGHWEQSAGYYVHIEPGEVFLGGGIYMPDGAQLKKIRRAIAERSEEFLSIVSDKRFRKRFGNLEGEKLQRAPLGYPPDHPMIEWLKFKQLFGSVTWKEEECYSGKFVDKTVAAYKDLLPFIRFINTALSK